MARRSAVSIYSVLANGSTGTRVGTGVLVDAQLALVAPPLAGHLAGGEQPRLRLGIAAAAADVVEVLDVDQVRVSKGAGQVLVGLELAVPAQTSPDVVAGLQDAHNADSLRVAGLAALGGVADPVAVATGVPLPPPGVTPDGGEMLLTRRSPFCVLMHWGCSKK